MSSYDTIIIGAGMSGLAAGIRLAYYNQRVCILERHTTIGGLNSFYRLGGQLRRGAARRHELHAEGARKGPLARLLRQLRFSWDDFSLAPQVGSAIAFPGISLRFNNNFEFFRSEVHRNFPHEKDNFRKLAETVVEYDDLNEHVASRSVRDIVGQIIKDPLLVDMLFCPLMFYGSAARERHGFRPVFDHVSQHFHGRLGAAPGPACG